jgi:protein TonB
MGKIVKFCDACNESFAEKFEYCPNCGKKMQAFEMNPLNVEKVEEPKATEKIAPIAFKDEKPEVSPEIDNSVTEEFIVPPTEEFSFADKTESNEESILELDSIDEPKVIENTPRTIEVAPETFIPRKPKEIVSEKEQKLSEETPEPFVPAEPVDSDIVVNDAYYSPYSKGDNYKEVRSVNAKGFKDKDFHVAMLTEKNTKQRNLLLLGAMLFMVSLSLGAVIYSLFNFNLDIASIDEDMVAIVPIIDEVPMNVEEEIQLKKEKEGGGGGGGGRDEETPTSKGQLAPQTREPIFMSPSKTNVKKDFELKQQAYTEGDIQNKQTDEPYGDPTSKYSVLSDGKGSGGGQGSGSGTGQGSGEGTGRGSGKGSGSGSGIGTGNGPGSGGGNGASDPKPDPPKPSGISKAMQLISKPQPRYTEEARKNNFQGSVTLRVTFNANGTIGSVAAVNRLPYGLTEEAIAAARRIQFKPAMRNGQPIAESKRIQYSFTIY